MSFNPAAKANRTAKPRKAKAEKSEKPRAEGNGGKLPSQPLRLALPIEGGYATNTVELRYLSPRLAGALRHAWRTAQADGVKVIKDGREQVINSGADMVRKWIEDYANKVEAETDASLVTDFGYTFYRG